MFTYYVYIWVYAAQRGCRCVDDWNRVLTLLLTLVYHGNYKIVTSAAAVLQELLGARYISNDWELILKTSFFCITLLSTIFLILSWQSLYRIVVNASIYVTNCYIVRTSYNRFPFTRIVFLFVIDSIFLFFSSRYFGTDSNTHNTQYTRSSRTLIQPNKYTRRHRYIPIYIT